MKKAAYEAAEAEQAARQVQVKRVLKTPYGRPQKHTVSQMICKEKNPARSQPMSFKDDDELMVGDFESGFDNSLEDICEVVSILPIEYAQQLDDYEWALCQNILFVALFFLFVALSMRYKPDSHKRVGHFL